MKRLLLIAFMALSLTAIAQTNTFPASGNVGIGTINPQATLQIGNSISNVGTQTVRISTPSGGAGSVVNALHIDCGNDGNYDQGVAIALGLQNSGYGTYTSRIVHYGNSANTRATKLQFQTHSGTPEVWNTGMVIDDKGYVGIGTTNPGSKLVISEGTNGVSINSGNISGLGFNRNVSDGAIYNPNLSGWQFTARDERFSLEGYNGAASILFNVLKNGNVGIGTQNPAYKLDVLGIIRAKEVLVNLDGGADFVFEKGYKLLPIEHVANYVQENKHLPDIPSANEMVKNGVSMGDMQVKLLQKVEELTLYAIQQDRSKKELEAKLAKQENQYNALLEKVEMLTKQMEKK